MPFVNFVLVPHDKPELGPQRVIVKIFKVNLPLPVIEHNRRFSQGQSFTLVSGRLATLASVMIRL